MYWKVQKINFDGKKAISVDSNCIFTGKRKTYTAMNGGEIIICAGALGSPKILINSLLKPVYSNDDSDDSNNGSHKQQVGWKSSPVFIPGIGNNLQDHTTLPLISFSNWSSPLKNGKGNTLPPNGVHGWINLDKDGNVIGKESSGGSDPVAQLLYVDGRISAALLPELMLPYYDDDSLYSKYLRPFLLNILLYLITLSIVQWFCSHCSGFLVCGTRRQSKGSILLNPDNPLLDFTIDPQYNDHNNDDIIVKNGINTANNLLKSFGIHVSIFPFFFLSQSKSIKLFTTSYYHICGTCSMPSKTDPNRETVVDDELRVKGIKNLRIADASVIPEIPSGPITATIMCIGVAAAEFIKKR
jgi:choline dehydrogenase-like flavoprotein